MGAWFVAKDNAHKDGVLRDDVLLLAERFFEGEAGDGTAASGSGSLGALPERLARAYGGAPGAKRRLQGAGLEESLLFCAGALEH